MKKPFVSVIIPCRNEEALIEKCLHSVISQDYEGKLEVLVIDGLSDDGTREIIKKFEKKFGVVKFLDNKKKTTPCALNCGITHARGEIIVRMDAHAFFEKNYISKCVKYLLKPGVENVGGVMKIIPQQNSFLGETIALASSSAFGTGNAYYKIGLKKPRMVDTVPFGCYRRETFEKIGLFNEKLDRNQDNDFNYRLRKAGGKIILVPEIVSNYYVPGSLTKFLKKSYHTGFWNIYSQKISPGLLSIRHFTPLFFVIGLLGSLVLAVFSSTGKLFFFSIASIYILMNLFFSLKISLERGLRYFLVLPPIFFSFHFSYGLGSLIALSKFLSINRRRG